MAVIEKLLGLKAPPPKPIDPYWQRNANMKYMPLFAVACRPGALRDRGGVFIVWGNRRVGWIYCGHHGNMLQAVEQLANCRQILEWSHKDTLIFSYAPVKDEARDGVVAYLRATMRFRVNDPELDAIFGMNPGTLEQTEPIPVLPPA